MGDTYSDLPESEWMPVRPRTAEERAHDLALELLGTRSTSEGVEIIQRVTGLTLCLTGGRLDFAGLATVASLTVIEAWMGPRHAELRRLAESRHDVV